MNSWPTFHDWLGTLGALALQGAIVPLAAGLLQTVLRSPRWRRAAWLAALAGLALVLVNALMGLDRELAGWLVAKSEASPRFKVRGNLPLEAGQSLARAGAGISEATPRASIAPPAPESIGGSLVCWPAWIWLGGAVVTAVGAALPRLWLIVALRRESVPTPTDGRQRFELLGARLGLRRPVRVVVSSRLAGPIAFGVWRPSVGLPADFWTANGRAEQDAMLVHELAHLRVRDPLWLTLADALVALLWWQPFVWWARRQFRAASETAADEASLVVEDGPAVLAGCLVALASRWQQRGVLGLLGMAGFRSGLGRRVERLLRLAPGEAGVSFRPWQRLVFGVATAGALALAVAVPWFVFPVQAGPGTVLLAALGEALARSPDTTSATPSAADSQAAGDSRAEASGADVRAEGQVEGQAPAQVTEVPGADNGEAGVVSLQVSPEGRTLLNQREQTAESLRSELRRLRAESSNGLVVQIAAARTASYRDVSDVVEACREAGLVRISLRTAPETVAAGETQPVMASTRLFTRVFQVNPDLLAEQLRPLGVGAESGATNRTNLEALRRLFAAAGVELGDTNVFAGGPEAGAFQSPQGRAVFLSERNGMLLVRGTQSDLEAIEQVLQVVNTAPPQVTLEAKFVEVRDEGGPGGGWDWFLGGISMSTNAPTQAPAPIGDAARRATNGVFPALPAAAPSSSTLAVATVTGLKTNPPSPEAAAVWGQTGANGPRELRGDQLDWAGRQAPNASNITVSALVGAKLTGVLSDPQFRVVLRALEQRSGVDVLAAPRVTTLSGRQAQVQAVDLKPVLTGVDPTALRLTAPPMATKASPFTVSTIPIGPTLDLIPVVAADGQVIQLTVVASVTEFLGYDAPPKGAKVRVWEGGESRLVDPPLPRFRVRQMQTQAQMQDGQTLLLGGFPVEETQVAKDKVAVLGDLPLAGGLFRGESKRSVRKMWFVFVTATLIDPAGNPLPPRSSTGTTSR